MGNGDVVLDFLTNLCGLKLGTAVPKVKGFLDAGVSTRAQLFALTDSELKACGLTHAAQRKKVSVVGGHPQRTPRARSRAGPGWRVGARVVTWLGAQVLATIRKGEAGCVPEKKAKRSSGGARAFADADEGG